MLNKMTSFKQMVLVFMLIESYTSYGALALSMDYYRMSCPFAEMIVRMTVNQALRRDQTLAGPLLRLHFHDCFVQGCDASVLIDSTEGNIAEKDSPANIILRGYEVIDQAKQIIENRCPGVVSCADIVAISARDAVVWAGGPFYPVLQGRRDGSRSKIEDTINLPPPNFNSTALISMFGRHGFTIQDLVALSGGHTIGVARCASFKDRLRNSDSTMNTNLVRMASMQCNGGDDNTTMNLDMTSTSFDNSYFRALQRGYGLLTSDETLFMDDQTRGFVDIYAMNQARWFYDFQSAMLKMGSIDVKEGDDGNVRLNCHRLNY